MNDTTIDERLAQAAQVKRIFDALDDIVMYNERDQRIGLTVDNVREELTDLLRSLGVEVVR